MITERQEQIENGMEVLLNAENYLNCTHRRTVSRNDAIDLLANLRANLAWEWNEIEAKKCTDK